MFSFDEQIKKISIVYHDESYTKEKFFHDSSYECEEYDNNGNRLYYNDSTGQISTYKYDDKNRLVYFSSRLNCSPGEPVRDNNGLIMSPQPRQIFEAWYEYDDKKGVVHYRDTTGENYHKPFNK